MKGREGRRGGASIVEVIDVEDSPDMDDVDQTVSLIIHRRGSNDVKATAINVDDIAALQDTTGGGWCFHFATPEESKPVRVTKPPSLMPVAASGQRGRLAPQSDLECSACSWWAAASGQAWCLLWAPTASG